MKSFAFILFSLFVFKAQASAWQGIKCSNSDASVVWESGYQEEIIHLKYANFVEGVLSLPLEQVNVQFSKDLMTLKEKAFRGANYSGMSKIFAVSAKITASPSHPDVLRSLFPENKVETEVICTSITTN